MSPRRKPSVTSPRDWTPSLESDKPPISGWTGTPGWRDRAREAAKKTAKNKAFLKALDRQLAGPKGT